MSVPFHKQLDPKKQAGQLTLADYTERKKEEPPRITFDEWWAGSEEALRFGERRKEHFKACWITAIKQGKLG